MRLCEREQFRGRGAGEGGIRAQLQAGRRATAGGRLVTYSDALYRRATSHGRSDYGGREAPAHGAVGRCPAARMRALIPGKGKSL